MSLHHEFSGTAFILRLTIAYCIHNMIFTPFAADGLRPRPKRGQGMSKFAAEGQSRVGRPFKRNLGSVWPSVLEARFYNLAQAQPSIPAITGGLQ